MKINLDVLLFEQFDHQYPLIKTRRELLTKKPLILKFIYADMTWTVNKIRFSCFHVGFIGAYRRHDNKQRLIEEYRKTKERYLVAILNVFGNFPWHKSFSRSKEKPASVALFTLWPPSLKWYFSSMTQCLLWRSVNVSLA